MKPYGSIQPHGYNSNKKHRRTVISVHTNWTKNRSIKTLYKMHQSPEKKASGFFSAHLLSPSMYHYLYLFAALSLSICKYHWLYHWLSVHLSIIMYDCFSVSYKQVLVENQDRNVKKTMKQALIWCRKVWPALGLTASPYGSENKRQSIHMTISPQARMLVS